MSLFTDLLCSYSSDVEFNTIIVLGFFASCVLHIYIDIIYDPFSNESIL